ncbi:MAG: tandem-95 repeat protein [Verrucomicrobiae bacterium]|nr:tandem-95 repeat protein [Verrucomicrobiae bacterium]
MDPAPLSRPTPRRRVLSKLAAGAAFLAALWATAFQAFAAAPTVTLPGAVPASIGDKSTSNPFDGAGVTGDSDVVITLSFPDGRGTFPVSPDFTTGVSAGVRSYVLTSRSPGAAAGFLDGLVFTPVQNRIPIGSTEATVFTVQAVDTGSLTGSGTVTLTVSPVNDSPTILFGSPGPAGIFDNQISQPFANVTVNDVDAGDALTATITYPSAHGILQVGAGSPALTLGGSAGNYTVSSASVADMQNFLRRLEYVPTENRLPVAPPAFTTESTVFSVTVRDIALASASASEDVEVESFNDAPTIGGALTSPVPDNAPALVFQGLTIRDPDWVRVGATLVPQPVDVVVTFGENVGAGAFPDADEEGVFEASGPAVASPPSTTSVEAQVRTLLFEPTANRQPVGATESVSLGVQATDSLGASGSSTLSFEVLSINDPPTLEVTLNPLSVRDTETLQPLTVRISDPDIGETFSVEIVPISDPTFQYAVFEPSGVGPYTGTLLEVQDQVAGIRFRPIVDLSANQQVTFRLRLVDVHSPPASPLTGDPIESPNLTLTIVGVNDPPEIAVPGGVVLRTTDDVTGPRLTPFREVNISDRDGDTLTVSLSVEGRTPGVFYLSIDGDPEISGSVLTFSGSPATVSRLIKAVTFQAQPRPDRLVGQQDTIQLVITVNDGGGGLRIDKNTTVVVTAVNGAPRIEGLPLLAAQPLRLDPATDTDPVRPFDSPPSSIVTVLDDDGAAIRVTVRIDDPAKGHFENLGGFVEQSSPAGSYLFVGMPDEATDALRGLEFVVSETHLFPPNEPGRTTFTIEAQDAVLNKTTRVLSIVLAEEPRNWLVTTEEDGWDEGSLRWVLDQIETRKVGSAVVTFALPEYPAVLRLSEGTLELRRNVTLKGPGADLLAISGDIEGDGEPDVQLFRIEASVVMEGLQLTHGAATSGSAVSGGAIYVGPTGSLTLRACAITDSVATQWGGGVDVDGGRLRMEDCLVRGNRTDSVLGLGGGGISLFTDQECVIQNTTFSGNLQGAATGIGGGGLYVENVTPATPLTVWVTHATFAGNDDLSGRGGTSIHANVFGTQVTVRNSVFADARARNLEVQGTATLVSDGGNVSDDQTRTVLTQDGQPKAVVLLNRTSDRTDRTGILVLPLNEQMRPVAGYDLAVGSPAIGRAVSPFLPTDQRGAFRDNAPDAGAVERGAIRRVVLNEIDYDPIAPAPQFLEFFIPRDSVRVDLSGYGVRVDGVLRFTFPASTRVNPGHGIVVADTAFAAAGFPAATPVLPLPTGESLELGRSSEIELVQPGGRVILRVGYVAHFVDPYDPLDDSKFDNTAITLAPQSRGFAHIPHGIVNPSALGGARDLSDPLLDPQADPNSPGAAILTPFGSPNAEPLAVGDVFVVDEDRAVTLDVLANDIEDDGTDRAVIVHVSTGPSGLTGDSATAFSARGALVTLDPDAAPLRGAQLIYDPQTSASLRALPVGAEATDTFHYTILDIGSADVEGYEGVIGDAPTTVRTPSHRLVNGDVILLSGSSLAPYNGVHSVTVVDDDTFEIPVPFAGVPIELGHWETALQRSPTTRSEARVTVTVLGANDFPMAVADRIPSSEATEETVLRIMAGPFLTGVATVFDTDSLYPVAPVRSSVTLLGGNGTPDLDPDTDDDHTTLRVVGIVGAVQSIDGYASGEEGGSVEVTSIDHGLDEGTVILISGYQGYSGYNGFHAVTVLDADRFSIGVPYVDDAAGKGHWAVLDDANRLRATSARGAEVHLEIRVDRLETSVVYNPRTSAELDALAVGEILEDTFFYAVSDRHGAVSLGLVTVEVSGVNDPPQPVADPASLAQLDSLTGPGATLADTVAGLTIAFHLPPDSGLAGRADAHVYPEDDPDTRFLLLDLFSTDEETALTIAAADLLENDSDIDTSDTLRIRSVAAVSWHGATVTLAPGGASLIYNPAGSSRLQALSRGEPLLDTFHIVVTDDQVGGDVESLVAVLVIGVNDTPVAVDDAITTDEDTAIAINPIQFPPEDPGQHDSDVDQDGSAPDDILRLVPEVRTTPAGALLTIGTDTFTYDPTVSAFLNGLAVGQIHVENVPYTVMDGSFLFANDDRFQVAADGAGYALEVLANDRNLTGVGQSVVEYAGIAGQAPVRVTSPGHGLASGMVVGVEGYGGDGLYNRSHTVQVLDADTFTIPVNYEDNHAVKGHWTRLRVTAVTAGSQGGTLAIGAGGGSVVYSPEVNFVGDEVFAYTLEDGMGNMDVAVVSVRVVVRELNGALGANADRFSVARGQSAILDVLANDPVLPVPAQALTVTRVVSQPTLHPGGLTPRDAVEVVDNRLRYVQTWGGPPSDYPYEVAFRYEISGGGTARATAEVRVRVIDRHDTLVVRPDAFGVLPGSVNNLLEVLENDSILPGTGDILTVAEIVDPPLHGTAEVQADGGAILYTPAAGFVGEDDFTYRAVDNLGGTGLGTVVVTVGQLVTSSDFFTVPFNDPARADDNDPVELDVLQNDTVLGAAPVVLTLTGVAPISTSLGTMSLRGDGQRLIFTVNEDVEGEQEFLYTLQDQSSPPRTAQGRVTVVVARQSVRANPDFFAVAAGSTENRLEVLGNDVAIPDRGRALTLVSVGTGLEGPDRGGTVLLAEDRKSLIYTPASGFVGQETFLYTMTDSRGTDTTKVVVNVGTGHLSAQPDAFTVFFQTPAPREFVLRVLANDRVLPDGGQALTITGVGIDDANGSNAPTENGEVRIAPDGTALIYVARNSAGPFPYLERFTYEISDGTERRAEAVVWVEVRERTGALALETHPDAFSVEADSTSNRLPVLANDGVKPASAAGWSVEIVSAPAHHGLVVVDQGTVLYSPAPGFIGTDIFTYAVSDGVGGTGSATVQVRVGDLPMRSDAFAALSGSAGNVLAVLANDGIRPLGAQRLRVDSAGPADRGGTVTAREDAVLYQPDPGYSGTYPYVERFSYVVLDDSGLPHTNVASVEVHQAGTDRDVGTVVVTVLGVNDPPTLENAGPDTLSITDKQTVTPFAGVTIGEVDDQGNEPIEVRVVLDDPAGGRLTHLGGFAETVYGNGAYAFQGTAAAATAAIRGLVFEPTENYVTVPATWTFTFDILVTDPHVTLPTAGSVQVQVQAINDPPVISGTLTGQPVYYRGRIKPFASVTITELDDLTLQPLGVTLSFDATRGALVNLNGFTAQGSGVFGFAGTAAQATAALRGVVFEPDTANRLVVDLVPPPGSEETFFTLTVEDGYAAPVVDANTSVIAVHSLIREALPTGTSSTAAYGFAVGASRHHAAIGAPEESGPGSNAGAVYVRSRNSGGAGQWGQAARLVPTDPLSGAQFGRSVAMDRETVVAGAPGARAGTITSGAVYVFEPSAPGANDWQAQAVKLVPSDPVNTDTFGFAVAISGDIIAVGAPQQDQFGNNAGAVYLFRRTAFRTWSQAAKIIGTGSAAGDRFGHSVSISGDYVVAGAPENDVNGSNAGAAYVFRRTGLTSWIQEKRLLPLTPAGGNGGASADQFGFAVAIDDDHAVVGAPLNDEGGNNRGGAYLYRRDLGGTGNWGQVRKLLGPDALNNDEFGRSVSISENVALIGMPFAGQSNQSRWGVAFSFGRDKDGPGAWGVLEKIIAPDNTNNDEFSYAVALSCGTAVIGARRDNSFANSAGSAYIYDLRQNKPPYVATPLADQVAVVGQLFSFVIPAATFGDADVDDELAFSVAPLPGWLTFNPATRTLSGTPPGPALGLLVLNVTATDWCGDSAVTPLTIEVFLTPPPMLPPPGAPLSYEEWIARLLIARILSDPALEDTVWGRLANPDGDPFTNFEEYAFGTRLFAETAQDGPGLTIALAPDGRVAIGFRRRSNDGSLTFTLEFSTDLDLWIDAASLPKEEIVVAIGHHLEWVTCLLPSEVLSQNLFFRVRIDSL